MQVNAAPAAGGSTAAQLRQPPGFGTLFFTELWERFSFAGMRAILVLFMAAPIAEGGLGLGAVTAASLYAVYNSMVYMLSLPGGWIADRLWGSQKAVFVGGCTIAAGHLVLTIPAVPTSYAALVLIAIGTGTLKASVPTILGGLYAPDDPRRDPGFTLYYLSIQIGGFTAPFVTGALAVAFNWHVAFAAAGIGMLLGLAVYTVGRKKFGDVGATAPQPATPEERRKVGRKALLWGGAAAALLAIDILLGWFSLGQLINIMSIVGLVVPIVYFAAMFRTPEVTAAEKSRLWAFVWFFVAAALFWLVYDQAGSTVSLFIKDSTDRTMFGWEVPVGFFQSAHAAFMITLGSAFVLIWAKMGRRQPKTPAKFGISLTFIGASFLLLGLAATTATDGDKALVWWIVGFFFLQGVAETHLGPVGLSASSKLAPARFATQTIGLWYLSTATGGAIQGQVVKLQNVLSPPVYFASQGLLLVLAGVILFLAARRIKGLMGEAA
ncbi:peptide MFS transporter [Prauserella flavalba]|uniref:peptide MFS transporter n=1 Tax=Prauserella flavalba TaxID=1477506 RepID=UPI0036E1016C